MRVSPTERGWLTMGPADGREPDAMSNAPGIEVVAIRSRGRDVA